MKHLIFCICMLLCVMVSGCAGNLQSQLYEYTIESEGIDRATGFVALSNMNLSQKEIDKIEKDYRKAETEQDKYLYEFLLSKRTQDLNHIRSFVEKSWSNVAQLTENRTNWVSFESPFYKQVAYCARSNQSALELVFNLAKTSGGDMAPVYAEDLSEIKKINPNMFDWVTNKIGFSKEEIENLIGAE